jgi:uncharacterized protein YbaR (Trm112 family)
MMDNPIVDNPMVDHPFIQCPETKAPLREATAEELSRLQQRQAAGRLLNRLGRRVVVPIDSGLVSEGSGSFYCVVQGVVWLIAEESIPLVAGID